MSDGGGRPKADLPQGRGVLAALRRVLAALEQGQSLSDEPEGPEKPDLLKPPRDSFADGVDAERELRRHLGIDAYSRELGDFTPRPAPQPVDADAILSVGGNSHVLRFPQFLAMFFAWLDPAKTKNLMALAALDARHVDAIKVAGRREMVRQIKRATWRRARKWALAGLIAAFATAHWFADQIAWIGERLPALREAWAWFAGSWR